MKGLRDKIVKSAITSLFLAGGVGQLNAQSEFYNNGSAITVQAGALVTVQGEVVNTNAGANIGLIDNSGLITFSGNWTNNSTSGALMPTTGSVEMTGANQSINGTQPTRFNNLTLLGSGVKTLNVNTFVSGATGVLALTARPLDLNSNTLFVTNPLTGAITRTTGYIISETAPVPGYGIVQWNIGTATGNYVFPFGTLAANYIPLNLNITTPGVQSTIGGISASTYPTLTNPALNNRPLPTGVADLNNNCPTEHATKMLDRFWVLNTSNYNVNPVADKQFTYMDDEWDATAGSTNLITETDLQVWHYATNWNHLVSTNNSGTNTENLVNNSNYGVFTLGEYKKLDLQFISVDSVVCFGENNGAITFTSNVGYGAPTYSLNGAAITNTLLTTLTAGTYTIAGQDIMGCRDTINSVKVFEPTKLLLTISSNDYSICQNDPIKVTTAFSGGIKPYTVNWSTGASNTNVTVSPLVQNLNPLVSTSYWTKLTDYNNCVVFSDTIDVNVNDLPNISFSANPLEGCQPLEVNFTNLSAASPTVTSWLWDFGSGIFSSSASPTYTYNASGTFNVSLRAVSDSGCINKLTKPSYILVHPKPVASFYYEPVNDIDILHPEVTFHNTSTGDDNTFWNFGDAFTLASSENPMHSYSDTGDYKVTLIVSTVHGCYDTTMLPLRVNEISTLYIPNAFTPDGNENNDVFKVYGLEYYDYTMMIFNRWGQKIFESSELNEGWDGKFKGTLSEEGVYVYKVIFKESKGPTKRQIKSRVGHVMLLRVK